VYAMTVSNLDGQAGVKDLKLPEPALDPGGR
jgi:hypothetical protein